MSLFEIESLFLLGHYQAAINAATMLKTSDTTATTTRDFYLYRAQIELGDHALVAQEISQLIYRGDAPPTLQTLKTLALALSSAIDAESAFQQVNNFVLSGAAKADPLLQLAIGHVYFRLNKLEDCLKVLYNTQNYEGRAIIVQLYLMLNRTDLAQRELARLQSLKDDAIATQLASSWVNSVIGGAKARDAAETLQELIDKYGPSVSLLNGVAVALIKQGNFVEAEKRLRDALLLDNKNVYTLVNLVVVSEFQQKSADFIRKQLATLQSAAPDHPWLIAANRANDAFSNALAQFEASLRAK